MSRWVRSRLDYSRYPSRPPPTKEVEESVAKGSGPGGQSVNRARNAVRLRHVPTGAEVRVHQSRSLQKNREIAWKRLIEVS